jgi:hypothetical protein
LPITTVPHRCLVCPADVRWSKRVGFNSFIRRRRYPKKGSSVRPDYKPLYLRFIQAKGHLVWHTPPLRDFEMITNSPRQFHLSECVGAEIRRPLHTLRERCLGRRALTCRCHYLPSNFRCLVHLKIDSNDHETPCSCSLKTRAPPRQIFH